MMIDKEVYRGMSPRDSLIMKMARNEVEIDEVIEAREFLDALKKNLLSFLFHYTSWIS